MAISFYNAGDNAIYDSGSKFVPQEKYRLGYTAPVQGGGQDASTPSFGIPATNAFTNSGGNNFSSTGNAFGYGSPVSEVNVRTFNPRELPGAMTPGGQNANTVYNQAFKDLNNPSLKGMSNDFVGKRAQDVMDYANESIMDYRQNYGAGNTFNAAGERTGAGQFESPYDDSMDLGYQGTIGKKGMLNRFKNTIGQATKFAGGLLPFPLNMVTKLLPKGDDNGPGGGTYGIAGLSDAQKEAYNTLAKGNMLFNGQSGMKTLTGKNFTGKGYMQGQRDIYNDKFAGMSEEDIAALTGFQKKQYQESSALFKDRIATEKKLRQDYLDRQQGLIGTRGTGAQGTSSIIQGEGGGNDPGTSRASDHSGVGLGHNAGNVRSANAAGKGSAQGHNQHLRSGGRAGYFFGGRVNFKNGGLASIL